MSTEYEYKLSVVVLVYNTEAYLEECLNSLVNQTLDNIEIICVNDESKDNSLNILRKYEKKYDNIRVIDQKNAGGANAGNRGLKEAKGEYVAILDSDDVVVEDAYEKLYNKAKETGSYIVTGKPMIYSEGYQHEIVSGHNIWREEKTFIPEDYLDIYYDVFYWNKIFLREFVEKHDIYMIPGKLYADAPMVFRGFNFTNKITITNDFVYYWRKRDQELVSKGDIEDSITKTTKNIKNMKDRLETYYYLKDYFEESGKSYFNKFIKLYMERFFYPIAGILKDEEFKKAYLKELYNILIDIEDIYDNKLTNTYNLYIYFILNNEIDALEDFITLDKNDGTLINEGEKTYWKLKYFRNEKYNIPDELFEIKQLQSNFISIKEIHGDSDYIYINELTIPKSLDISNPKIKLTGLTEKYNLFEDNCYEFDLEEIDKNKFNAKIPIKEIKNINVYNPHLEFKHENRVCSFRLQKIHFIINQDNIEHTTDKIKPYFTKYGNLSLQISKAENLFNINVDEEGIIITEDEGDINYKLFIGTGKKSSIVTFVRNYENKDLEKFKNELELKWKYSLEKNIEYKLYCQLNKDEYLIDTSYFKNYEDKTIIYNNMKIKIWENKDKTISIKMTD